MTAKENQETLLENNTEPKAEELLPNITPCVQASCVQICIDPSESPEPILSFFPSHAIPNHVDLLACCRCGFSITNAIIAFSEDVPDYAIAVMLEVLRRIPVGNRYIRASLLPQKGDYPLGCKDVMIINVALINEKELVQCLLQGNIAGAGSTNGHVPAVTYIYDICTVFRSLNGCWYGSFSVEKRRCKRD
ncbi:unnamed protein product [Dovyalis caffra]|uniref:Uncharacterized protein n=1 Tax=Dovyalis caffra TaxID=77055 RepID=A0AAV1RI46_9ROSI|nr:unnamed protein product [Dovyalis caffra]CAK7335410.1 unnamed protein product [Dovyalis caffra]